MIDTIIFLNEKKIGFKSLQENTDTTTSGGKLVFHIFSTLVKLKRDIIHAHMHVGLSIGQARSKNSGRHAILP